MSTTVKKVNLTGKDQESCPIFLRKTYHMIDTCDSDIACWSEDGETFVVKNTDVFEKKIIPQFFKHNKFSSFVRQLNFYGFRKIKYADTIKIDAKLEAETANFWRFRHEKFQRGKPEQLVEIKRMSGQQHQQQQQLLQQQQQQKKQQNQQTQNSNNKSAANPAKDEDAGALRSEVSILKKRIEDMTKNIDNLTSLVSKVTLKEEEKANKSVEDKDENAEVGSKRKKVDSGIRPDGVVSSKMILDEDISFAPSSYQQPMVPLPQGLGLQQHKETSAGDNSQISDELFVDQLFTEFANDGMDALPLLDDSAMPLADIPTSNGCVVPTNNSNISNSKNNNNNYNDNNRPDPILMSKLSDALSLLPREIQEMIINRLIESITSTGGLAKNADALSALSEAAAKVNEVSNQIPPSPVLESKNEPTKQQEVSLPLAAATLAAMLSQYSSNCKNSKSSVQQKSIPVIPIHA